MNEATTSPVSATTAGAREQVPLDAALRTLKDDHGRTLADISNEKPTLLVLLRHTGCTFCRETIAELAKRRSRIAALGTAIAVVGMAESTAPLHALGERFGLGGVHWIADPGRLAYRALELPRGGPLELFGPRAILRGLRGLLRGYGIGRIDGDPRQMPGAAVVHRGRLLRVFRHRSVADRPDLEGMACGLGAT